MPESHPESAPKTERSQSSSSWSDLLLQLIRSFVLLRDIFGYLLPGAAFLLIGSVLGQLSMFGRLSWLGNEESHPWLFALVLAVISYVVGQFVVTTSYLPGDIPRTVAEVWYKLSGKRPETNEEEAQDEADFLRLQAEFPEIYVEYDTQSIIALLRRGLAASVVLATLVFYYLHAHPVPVIAGAGAIMLFNALSGHFYLRTVLKPKTLRAARGASAAKKRTGG